MIIARSRHHRISLTAFCSAFLVITSVAQSFALEPGAGAEVKIEKPRSIQNIIRDLRAQPHVTEATFDVKTTEQLNQLASLQQLRTLNLYVRGNGVDLSALKSLKNLEQLNLGLFSQTGSSQKWLAVLSQLPSLKKLELYHSQPANAQKKALITLPAMASLESLSLKGFGDTVYDFAPGFHADRLRSLELATPTLVSQSRLSNFRGLEKLTIGSSFVLDKAGSDAIANMSALKEISANSPHRIPLASLQALNTVTFGEVLPQDIAVIAKLPHLAKLAIKPVNCSDKNLAELANAANLKELYIDIPQHFADGKLVSSSPTKGEFLASLANSTQLKKLSLENMPLNENLVHAISQISALESLDIASDTTPMTPSFAKQFNRLRNLSHFNVPWPGSNMIECLQACPDLNKLTSLVMYKQGLTDADIKLLAKYPALTSLDLSENQLTDSSIETLRQLKKLQVLQLTGNKSVTGESLAALTHLPSIQQLYMNNTGIDEAHVAPLADNTTLTLLDLSQTNVGPKWVSNLNRLAALRQLGLSGTDVDDSTVALLHSKALQELKLEETNITENGIQTLSSLPSLRVISAFGTGIKHGAPLPEQLTVSYQTGWFDYDYDAPRITATKVDTEEASKEAGYLRDAAAFYSKGNFAKAIESYNKAIAAIEHPDHYVCSVGATEHKHSLFEAYDGRGLALSAAGEHEKALADLNRAAQIAKASANVRAHRGLVLSKLGRHSEALSDLNRALQIKPNLAAAYEYRANVHMALGNQELADKDKQESRKLGFKPEIAVQPSNPTL